MKRAAKNSIRFIGALIDSLAISSSIELRSGSPDEHAHSSVKLVAADSLSEASGDLNE